MSKTQNGFSLIEASIVLVVAGLMLSAAAPAILQLNEAQRRRDMDGRLSMATEALIGYALSHPLSSGRGAYLPCPATFPGAGESARNSSGNCLSEEGFLPAATLALAENGAEPMRYRVDRAFANSQSGIMLGLRGGLQICTNAICTTKIGENVGAVVLFADSVTDALGEDGRANRDGIDSGTGVALPCLPSEEGTLSSTCTYVMHAPTDPGASGGAFADRLTWLPSSILMSRLVLAERLP